MKILIKAGLVYPVSSEPVTDVCISISDGRIESIGREGDFVKNSFDSEIDLSGKMLFPGFVNAHSHLQLSSARNRITYKASFTGWIRDVIHFNGNEGDRERTEGILDGIGEMLGSGITAVADIVSDAKYAKPLLESPLRSVVFAEAISPLERGAAESFGKMEAQLEQLGKNSLKGISPHAPYTVSPKLFRLLKETASDKKLPLMMHIAESAQEAEFIKNGTGDLRSILQERGAVEDGFNGWSVSPVALVTSEGIPEGLLAVHLNVMDEDDIERIISARAVPVFCPGSSRWFGRKDVMPLGRFIESGLQPAIGTDSLASNSSLSMLDELRHAARYFPTIDRRKLIEMATINGARSLKLDCGEIEKGRWADIIGFDWSRGDDPVERLFAADKADLVMIGGKALDL